MLSRTVLGVGLSRVGFYLTPLILINFACAGTPCGALALPDLWLMTPLSTAVFSQAFHDMIQEASEGHFIGRTTGIINVSASVAWSCGS
ncbi:MAG: hypothetical protein R2865_08425 [Deinococcales bacterium]